MTPRALADRTPRNTAPSTAGLSLELRCFSYEERRAALPGLLDAVNHSGGWVLERQVLANGRIEFWLEFPLRAALEIYTAIVGVGMELTRAGHRDAVALCTLRQNSPPAALRARLVTMRLEVSFLDEDEQSYPVMASRAGLA